MRSRSRCKRKANRDSLMGRGGEKLERSNQTWSCCKTNQRSKGFKWKRTSAGVALIIVFQSIFILLCVLGLRKCFNGWETSIFFGILWQNLKHFLNIFTLLFWKLSCRREKKVGVGEQASTHGCFHHWQTLGSTLGIPVANTWTLVTQRLVRAVCSNSFSNILTLQQQHLHLQRKVGPEKYLK